MTARGGFLAAIAALALQGCEKPAAPTEWTPIEVLSVAVQLGPNLPPGVEVGELTFRGGLELTSTDPRFGGLSGLHVNPDSSFIAVSDAGIWFDGQIVNDAQGQLRNTRYMRIAAMRDEAGAAFLTKEDGDAEEIARLPDGRFAVSFEQRHRILIYDLEREGVKAAAALGPPLDGVAGLEPNGGLEALAVMSDGRLAAVAESSPGPTGNPFWLLQPEAIVPARPAGVLATQAEFAVAGMTRLPNGDLLRLDRQFAPLIGARVQFRLISEMAPQETPARLDGRVLAELAAPIALDNFEAVSAVSAPNGDVRIYILSDDNYAGNQRTLLYAFDWTPPPRAAPIAAVPPSTELAEAPQAAPRAAAQADPGPAPAARDEPTLR